MKMSSKDENIKVQEFALLTSGRAFSCVSSTFLLTLLEFLFSDRISEIFRSIQSLDTFIEASPSPRLFVALQENCPMME